MSTFYVAVAIPGTVKSVR